MSRGIIQLDDEVEEVDEAVENVDLTGDDDGEAGVCLFVAVSPVIGVMDSNKSRIASSTTTGVVKVTASSSSP